MKAALLVGHGGKEVVTVGERPLPRWNTGDILVRMKAATVNRLDLCMRDSGAGITHTRSQIMGVDGAGVIEEAFLQRVDRPSRDALPRHRLRDLRILPARRTGALRQNEFARRASRRHLAEYVCMPADNGLTAPDQLGFAQAAALRVDYPAAWRMLFTKARLRPGETERVFGMGGGGSPAEVNI